MTERNKEKRSALVVEGGAMRGIFSTGVLDAFLKNDFNPFDLYIGVSAGATNLAAYLGEMYERNKKVYMDYSLRPNFINWGKFLMGGHLVDLDWLWNITIQEVPLDLEKICRTDREYYIGMTDPHTGKAVYRKPDEGNLEQILKASSSIPIFYRNSVDVDGTDFVDGGLADPIPVMEAYKQGAKNIMVLRSRPRSYEMKPSKNGLFTKIHLKKYPKLIDGLKNRHKVYQEAIDFMRNPPKGVKVVEVNPPESFQTQRLTKKGPILEQDYRLGYEMGAEIIRSWNKEISCI